MNSTKKVLVNPISGSIFTALALGDIALYYFKVIPTALFVALLVLSLFVFGAIGIAGKDHAALFALRHGRDQDARARRQHHVQHRNQVVIGRGKVLVVFVGDDLVAPRVDIAIPRRRRRHTIREAAQVSRRASSLHEHELAF